MKLSNFIPFCGLFLLLLSACGEKPDETASPTPDVSPTEDVFVEATPTPTPYIMRDPEGATPYERINAPEGFSRVDAAEDSFAAWLRTLPLKEDGATVTLRADGTIKPDAGFDSVVNLNVSSKQMEKSDFMLALHARYLYEHQRYEEMTYHFYSGFLFDFDKWSDGYRIKVSGSSVVWEAFGQPDASEEVFQGFMMELHIYANPLSLARDAKAQNEMAPGMMLVRDRDDKKGWENALMIMDMAVDSAGRMALLLAGCGTPAQDGYILSNPLDTVNSPWYIIPENGLLETTEGLYSVSNLYAFSAS